jgi:hypothetical protein
MTPTLFGRWQTRLLLNLTIGVGISLLLGFFSRDFLSPFAILGYMTGLGLVWDVVYLQAQSRRWDHDWSPALYLAGAVWELAALLVLTHWMELPGVADNYGARPMLLQYSGTGFFSFLIMFGPMRILFPRWRFRGGQWF